MPTRVAIVDYGIGNVDSVRRAVELCGGMPMVTAVHAELRRAERIILPGVGAFPDGMRNLRERGLIEILNERVIGAGVPFLGICLGMQVLADRGLEGTETAGLGWIGGVVQRLEPAAGERVPHVGWNEVAFTRPSALFDGIPPGRDFYFVHSYHIAGVAATETLGTTPYAGGIVAAVSSGNVYGVQFHLEKSQRPGQRVLRNFLAL